MKTFEERLATYFAEVDLDDKPEVMEAIRKNIGEPFGTYEDVIANIDPDCEEEDYYDGDFENVLDTFSNIFYVENAVTLMLEDLDMVSIRKV